MSKPLPIRITRLLYRIFAKSSHFFRSTNRRNSQGKITSRFPFRKNKCLTFPLFPTALTLPFSSYSAVSPLLTEIGNWR